MDTIFLRSSRISPNLLLWHLGHYYILAGTPYFLEWSIESSGLATLCCWHTPPNTSNMVYLLGNKNLRFSNQISLAEKAMTKERTEERNGICYSSGQRNEVEKYYCPTNGNVWQ
jgi:hypothetical protein